MTRAVERKWVGNSRQLSSTLILVWSGLNSCSQHVLLWCPMTTIFPIKYFTVLQFESKKTTYCNTVCCAVVPNIYYPVLHNSNELPILYEINFHLRFLFMVFLWNHIWWTPRLIIWWSQWMLLFIASSVFSQQVLQIFNVSLNVFIIFLHNIWLLNLNKVVK
jgi:hypothetical protein